MLLTSVAHPPRHLSTLDCLCSHFRLFLPVLPTPVCTQLPACPPPSLLTGIAHVPATQLTMPHRKKASSRARAQQGTLGAWFSKPVHQDDGLESEYSPESESDEESEGSSKCVVDNGEETASETASETEASVKEAMSNLYCVFCPLSSRGHLTNAECVKVCMNFQLFSVHVIPLNLHL